MAEAGALDAVLTLDARQLGVMQPRPLATLHVGGPARFDGGLTVTGGVTASGAGTFGSLSVTGNLTAGSLTVTGSATVGGTLGVTGALTAGSLNTAGALSVGTTSSFGGHMVISMATGGIGTAAASEGQLELQNAGVGASKLTFHRTGAYAAYFGLDTDNIWKIGGWSMGAAAYRVILGDSYANSGNLVTTGAHIINTTGYIFQCYDTNNAIYFDRSSLAQISNIGTLFRFHSSGTGRYTDFTLDAASTVVWGGTATHHTFAGIIKANRVNCAGLLEIQFNGATVNFLDGNVYIQRNASTNKMQSVCYDAWFQYTRTWDGADCGHIDTTGYHNPSSLKYKRDIRELRNGLDLILDERVRPIRFTRPGIPRYVGEWVTEEKPEFHSIGFGAEDMADVIPEVVSHNDEGEAVGINYGSLVAVLWDALRTVNERLVALEHERLEDAA